MNYHNYINTSSHRRSFLAGISGIVGSLVAVRGVNAQFTEQEVRNGATVTSTGDVDINQSASGTQTVITDINGVPISGDGVYETSTGQVVVNDGRVVSTGDVSINQSASGVQDVSVHRTFPSRDGDAADVCRPGEVIANPDSGRVFFQANDCCWYEACANKCSNQGCEGDTCGS